MTLRAFRRSVCAGQSELRFCMIECGRGPTVHRMAGEAIPVELCGAVVRCGNSIVFFDVTTVAILCGPFESPLRMTR